MWQIAYPTGVKPGLHLLSHYITVCGRLHIQQAMMVAEKNHLQCIRDILAEPQNTDFHPSHILTLGP
jgi:hypothetical protein